MLHSVYLGLPCVPLPSLPDAGLGVPGLPLLALSSAGAPVDGREDLVLARNVFTVHITFPLFYAFAGAERPFNQWALIALKKRRPS